MEERRLFAEPLIREGRHTSKEIANLCSVTDSAVRQWRMRLHYGESLEATIAPGPARHLTDEKIDQTIDLIRALPIDIETQSVRVRAKFLKCQTGGASGKMLFDAVACEEREKP